MSPQMTNSDRPPVLLIGMLVAILGILLYAVIIQGGVVNPTIQRTQSEVREVVCAQAESTANAFRFRQVGPDGKIESREHFLTRMLAQRHVLLIAKDVSCKSAPGFPPFEVQVDRALKQINGILGYRRQSPTSEGGAEQTASAGGDAAQTGSTGYQQPGPREEGSSGDVGDEQQQGGGGGGSGGHQPKTPTPAPSPSPETVPAPSPQSSPGRSGDAPGDPEPPASSSTGTVHSTVEAAGGAVKEAGEGVGGAVEGVGKGVDCALRGAC
jgi:hypothetical protein